MKIIGTLIVQDNGAYEFDWIDTNDQKSDRILRMLEDDVPSSVCGTLEAIIEELKEVIEC